VLKRPAFCQKKHHEKEELKFFCKLCEVAVCSTCVVTLHEGHAKMLLEDAASERKTQIKSAIDSRKKVVLRKRNKITKIEENCFSIQAQVVSTKRNAQDFVDRMVEAIEAKKQEVFSKVEKHAKESLNRLRVQQCKLECQVKLIETAIDETERLLKRSTNAEIVRLDKNFQEGVSDEEEQLNCDHEGLCHFVFKDNETLMQKATSEGIGSLETFLSKTNAQQSSAEGKGISEAIVGLEAEFEVTTRNCKEEKCHDEFDGITVEIRNRQGNDCATKVQIQDNKDGTYKINYFAKETGTCQVSVKVNGEHVRGSPFEVLVKPRQYRPVLSFGKLGFSAGRLKSPWGLAVNERNEITVTESRNYRVQVFRSDGTCLRTFGRKGDGEGELNFPNGIARDSNDNIFAADCNNHRIVKFDSQGNYLYQIGSEGVLDHQLKHPRGLSIDSNGNILVADSANKQIKIFSPSGEILGKIGERSLIQPYDVVENGKHVVVSDSGDHSIKVFDLEGRFLYKFGGVGKGDGEFNKPRGLSFDKAGQLVICDSENHRIQVFDVSGTFVTKFGTEGSGEGQFNKPANTAILSDGRIVVSDFYNHRIHVFE